MAKAMRAASRPAPPAPPAAAPLSTATTPSPEAEPEKRPAPLALIGLLLIVAAAAAWWLNFPSSSGLFPDSYVNSRHQFALTPPREWLQLTPENFKQLIEEYKDRFPKELRSLITKPGFEVSFVRIPASPEEFTPSLNIVVIPMKQNLPPLTGADKDEAVKSITTELKKHIKDYTMESSSIVEVDGLASLQIMGSAPLTVILEPSKPVMSEKGAFGLQHVVGHSQAVMRTFTLRSEQLMVPGRKRAYVISYTADEGGFAEVAPVFRSVTGSFRVMERPPRFGPVVMGALNGGIIGAGIYVFYIFVGRVMIALSNRP
ncbi:MAG: hypothetical protein AABZ15_11095 [Nitrospirota bacterium]